MRNYCCDCPGSYRPGDNVKSMYECSVPAGARLLAAASVETASGARARRESRPLLPHTRRAGGQEAPRIRSPASVRESVFTFVCSFCSLLPGSAPPLA